MKYKPLLEKLRKQLQEKSEALTAALEKEMPEDANEETLTAHVTECEALNVECDKIAAEIKRVEPLAKIEESKESRLSWQTSDGERGIELPNLLTRKRRRPAFKLKANSPFIDEEHALAVGLWAQAVLAKKQDAIDELKGMPDYEQLTMTERVDGGVLVPTEVSSTIIQLIDSYGIFRSKAQAWGMKSSTRSVPKAKDGIVAYWEAEDSDPTASEPDVDEVLLTAHKLRALAKFTEELEEDSPYNIAEMIIKGFAKAMAYKEDLAGFNGDGTSTYGMAKGLKNAVGSAGVVTAATGNTAFSTLDLSDFENMVAKLPDFEGIEPEWYISKVGFYASMHRLAFAAGGNTLEHFENGMRPQFLGYPVNFTRVMNTTITAQASTSGLCYFGDMAMSSAFGDRKQMTIDASDQVYWTTDKIAVKSKERVAIANHSVGDDTNPEAMIMLSTPSS